MILLWKPQSRACESQNSNVIRTFLREPLGVENAPVSRLDWLGRRICSLGNTLRSQTNERTNERTTRSIPEVIGNIQCGNISTLCRLSFHKQFRIYEMVFPPTANIMIQIFFCMFYVFATHLPHIQFSFDITISPITLNISFET